MRPGLVRHASALGPVALSFLASRFYLRLVPFVMLRERAVPVSRPCAMCDRPPFAAASHMPACPPAGSRRVGLRAERASSFRPVNSHPFSPRTGAPAAPPPAGPRPIKNTRRTGGEPVTARPPDQPFFCRLACRLFSLSCYLQLASLRCLRRLVLVSLCPALPYCLIAWLIVLPVRLKIAAKTPRPGSAGGWRLEASKKKGPGRASGVR